MTEPIDARRHYCKQSGSCTWFVELQWLQLFLNLLAINVALIC
jgi:hypothetical protein